MIALNWLVRISDNASRNYFISIGTVKDKDTEVENLARTVKKMLEKMNGGESLDTYLFG